MIFHNTDINGVSYSVLPTKHGKSYKEIVALRNIIIYSMQFWAQISTR